MKFAGILTIPLTYRSSLDGWRRCATSWTATSKSSASARTTRRRRSGAFFCRGRRSTAVESSIRRPNKVSFCVAVPSESEGDHVVTLPATPALSLYHHGAYEDLPAADKKLRAYARRHGLTPTGKLRRIYLEGPPQHKDPAKFITQVALPLEEE